jgi:hypothetical protein
MPGADRPGQAYSNFPKTGILRSGFSRWKFSGAAQAHVNKDHPFLQIRDARMLAARKTSADGNFFPVDYVLIVETSGRTPRGKSGEAL